MTSCIYPFPTHLATCPATVHLHLYLQLHPLNFLSASSPTYRPFNPSSSHPFSCSLRLQFICTSPWSPSQTPIYPFWGGGTHPLTSLIHPSNQLPMYPLTNPTIHLPAHLPIHLPTYPFICPPSSHLSIHSSAITLSHPFSNPSIHPLPTHAIIPFLTYGGTIYPSFHHPSSMIHLPFHVCVYLHLHLSLN